MSGDLERWIDARLRELPAPKAPATLHARVMSAVAQRAPGRAAVPWFAWPVWAQAALVIVLAAGVAGAVWLISYANGAPAPAWPSWMVETFGRAADVARDVRATLEGVRVLLSAVLLQPMVLSFIAVVMVMTAACAMFGAMLGRIAALPARGVN